MVMLGITSCSVSRYVPDNKYLLKSNDITIEKSDVNFKKSDLNAYIDQQPSTGRMNLNIGLWFHYKALEKQPSKFWSFVDEHFGKEPVYYEKTSSNRSVRQMEIYLGNIGYFNSNVRYQVEFDDETAKVNYTVSPASPYRIKKMDYQIEDTVLRRYVSRIEDRFPVKENDIYNAYTLDDQRAVITEYLRNNGYYYFTRDYITYEIDSSFNDHSMEITMRIANEKDKESGEYHPHRRYLINQINIYPNYVPSLIFNTPTDSTVVAYTFGRRNQENHLHLYFTGQRRLRANTFNQAIQIQEGRPYRLRQVSQTYSALSNFKLFSNTSIEFDSVPRHEGDSINLLNCNILLQRASVHSYKVQAEGTESGGDLGINGSITYTNKNIFRGAEMLQLSLKGGLEAQKVVGISEIGGDNKIFNTKEFSLNASIYFPKFLSPIPLKNFARDYQPKTLLTLGSNNQIRYAYSRYIYSTTFGYDWKANPQLQIALTPIYLNSVKVDPIPEFQALLDLEENQRIKDQYTNHLIFGSRYSFTYNTQNLNRTSNYIYLRGTLELSGNVLSCFNNTRLIEERDGHHELLGIRYAQYVRADLDFRQFLHLDEENWFAFRQYIGLGLPYGNSYDMPFERSFYAGGGNGMRGWRYRQLGPGGYVADENHSTIERIGDIQLEVNAEYRFPIYSILEGAIFVDAGNVWNYHANEQLPNGEFRWGTFYKQVAMDGGFGIRADVKFVVLRIDLAFPIRNPYPDIYGSNWKIGDLNFEDLHCVFCIGYPF